MAFVLSPISCTPPAVQQVEDSKQLSVRAVEAINGRNREALNDLVAPDYVRHCRATPDVKASSLEKFKKFLQHDAATFPDSRMTIQRLVAEGDLGAFSCTYVGTQKGPMGPFPPSNKQMSLECAGVHRVEDEQGCGNVADLG